MATAIAKKKKNEYVVELERLELEINTEAFEAFYHIGQKLLDIKRKHRYEAAGFKTWGAYCASGRIRVESDSIGKKSADDYIRASELRPKLGISHSHEWGKWQMLELCKCETDAEAKRLAKEAISVAKKAKSRVTAKLIAELRRGSDNGDTSSRDAELADARLEIHLDKLARLLLKWRLSLKQVDAKQWDDVPRAVMTRVIKEAGTLHQLLRSRTCQ